jgi:hypothetical protein
VAALVYRAIASVQAKTDKVVPYLLCTKGLLYYRQGRFDAAIEALKGEVSPQLKVAPNLVLAMALDQWGQTAEARQTFAASIDAFDWSRERADNRFSWTCHVLRREAESVIHANSPNPFAVGHGPGSK